MLTSKLLSVLALVLNLRLIAALTDCPTAVTYFTDSDGARYAICVDTNLQGTSSIITNNITSNSACADLVKSVSERLSDWGLTLLDLVQCDDDLHESSLRYHQ
jgi:hypothetical protein